jgi:uncharacterized glyoxalase superfamily protein PhnB
MTMTIEPPVVSPIPEGFHTITPSITVKGAAEAIEFYKKAFGAIEIDRATWTDGTTIMHATIQIGSSRLMLNDEFPEMGARGPIAIGGTPVSMFLYVEDSDAVFNAAVAAGATVAMPMNDAFWGDRWGIVADPYGHIWQLSTRKHNISIEDAQKAMAEMGGECGGAPAQTV